MSNEIEKLLYPKSVAIVGASSKKGSLSWELVNNILNYGFQGKVFPINPKAPAVHSIKAYTSLLEVEDEIDLAIIMLPKDLVLNCIDECYKKKIFSVVVITAGFKEVGGEGAELEKKLINKIKKYGIRLVGPNCMGLINTNPKIRLNGTFVLGTPLQGGIGFVSQSGALGAAVLKTVHQNDVGLSQFISIGNKADISGNVILEFWKDNPDVKVITVYLESFGNPKRFMEISREISKSKPIIIIKSARTSAGIKAASSHTGALASADNVVDALLEQGGVIRVNTIEEMFDIAKGFDKTRLPKGNRVGILTNAGGPAILAVDETERVGLTIPELSKRTQALLRKVAPPEGTVRNPVDLLPPATAEMYAKATKLMLKDDNIDSLIVIIGPPLMLDTAEIASAICNEAKKSDKTFMLVLMSQDDVFPKLKELNPDHPPLYRYPESAAMTIGEMYQYKNRKEIPFGEYKNFEVNKSAVKKILSNQKQKGDFYLDFKDAYKILQYYQFPVIDSRIVFDIESAVEIVNSLGYPVVIKGLVKDVIHKTEHRLIELDIHSDKELTRALYKMSANLKSKRFLKRFEGFLIQQQLRGGIETIMGIFKDAKAGHLIMFGLGGIYVELFQDVKFRLLPVTDSEASSMVKDIRGYKLLRGMRGKPSVDIKFIEENLLRLSQLIEDFPQFIEIDFNPFVFAQMKEDCKILDFRMKVSLN